MGGGKNGFNIPDDEYKKLQNSSAYFRGLIVSEIRNMKEEIKRQREEDNAILQRLDKLPCNKIENRVAILYLIIAIIFLLLGYTNFPFILKFFGMQ